MNTFNGYLHIREPIEVSRTMFSNIPQLRLTQEVVVFFPEVEVLKKLHLDIGIVLANIERESKEAARDDELSLL